LPHYCQGQRKKRKKERNKPHQKDYQTWEFPYLGIWIGQEVGLNSLEQACCLFSIHILDLVFVDLSITLDVVCAGSLANGTSLRSWHELVLVSHLFNCILPNIGFNQAEAVGQVLFVNCLNLLLGITEIFSCKSKINLLLLYAVHIASGMLVSI